jgi:cytochrome c biogenesis protein CcdA
MIELLPKLIPMLIVDVLNPVLFALLVVAVGTNKPFANSTAFLTGHTAAYFLSGIIIALGLDQITDRLENPHHVDFVIELLLGLLCLAAALSSRDGNASKEKEPQGELTPVYCFGYGAVVNFIGVPFALPYLAAVDQLLKANLSTESSLLVLTLYNVAYAVPFLLVPIMVAIMGDDSKPILEKINKLLVSLVDRFMPIMLFLLGITLSIDALAFLVSGERLW